MRSSPFSQNRLAFVVGLLPCWAFSCADMSAPLDLDANGDKSLGSAEHVYYSCETATVTSTGSKWTYQTNEIMNLMPSIGLRVTQDGQDYGVQQLSRIENDTFSNGNLTVWLTQSGQGKSIEVEHKNVGLLAKAENGWCQADDRTPTDGSTDTTRPAGEFKLKMGDSCENPCRFEVSTTMPIASVRYEADEWILADSSDASGGFVASYSFTSGGLRTLKVTGFDRDGRAIASDSKRVDVTLPGQSGLIDVPYFYQYSNRLAPGATCQNTAVAMVLASQGVSIVPDQITSRYGRGRAQSVDGLKAVFNELAREYGVRGVRSTSQGTFAEVKAALDAGSPVIIHGYFTASGHVVVITGYNQEGYFVNDPAGKWSGYYKDGYPNAGRRPTEGKNVFYERDAFERAVGTLNGRDFVPMWIHVLN